MYKPYKDNYVGLPTSHDVESEKPRKIVTEVERIQRLHNNGQEKTEKVSEEVQRMERLEKKAQESEKPRKVATEVERIERLENKGQEKTEKVSEEVQRMERLEKKAQESEKPRKVATEVERIERLENKGQESEKPRKVVKEVEIIQRLQNKEQGTKTVYPAEELARAQFENFLVHVGLSRDNKLTAIDGICFKMSSGIKKEAEDTVSNFLMHLSTNDLLAMEKLSSEYTYYHVLFKTFCGISKRDILFAILNCCDPFMLQYLFCKLHACRIAIPMIVPSIDNSKLTFYLLGLRKCFQPMCMGRKYSAVNLSTYPIITVSAFRLGNIRFSKSDVLDKFKTTFQRQEGFVFPLSQRKDKFQSFWSKGTIELTWNVHEFDQDLKEPVPSHSLLNLRGDGLKCDSQVNLCIRISNIVFLFLSKPITVKCVKLVNNVSTTCHVIILADFLESDAVDLGLSKKITMLFCEGLSTKTISDILIRNFRDIHVTSARHWHKKSVEEYAQYCQMFGIEVDEQAFKGAKALATKVGKTIPRSIEQSQELLFPTRIFLKMKGTRSEKVEPRIKNKKYSQILLSHSFKTFLRFLSLDNYSKQIFLSSLNLFLDQKSYKDLGVLLNKYDGILEQIRLRPNAKSNFLGKEEGQFHDIAFDITDVGRLEKKMEQNVLNVGHFLDELWGIIMCSHPIIPYSFTTEIFIDCLSDWLMNGNSLNILKSDSCHNQAEWAAPLIKALNLKLGKHVKIGVLSIFGHLISPKAALLNFIFGATYNWCDTVFQEGLRIQLRRLQGIDRTRYELDFILLVDVESVRLSEIGRMEMTERRRRICKIVSSITDVLLISIDENGSREELETMYDIVVSGLLTTNLFGRCSIVCNVDNFHDFNDKELNKQVRSFLNCSCEKITSKSNIADERNAYSDITATLIDQSILQNVYDCFRPEESSTEYLPNIKVLPRNTGNLNPQLNQLFVRGICHLRTFIMQLLGECQQDAKRFVNIGDKFESEPGSFAINESKYMEQNHPLSFISTKVLSQYFFKSLSDISDEIVIEMNSASVVIEKAYDDINDETFQSKKVYMEKFASLRDNIEYLGNQHSHLSETCHSLVQSLNDYIDNTFRRIIKQFKQASYKASQNALTNRTVSTTFNNIVENVQQHSLATKQEISPTLIKKHIDEVTKKYCKVTFHEEKEEVTYRIEEELKKETYGKDVKTLINTTEALKKFNTSSGWVSSLEDGRKYKIGFNAVGKGDVKLLERIQMFLEELSAQHKRFEHNAVVVIDSFKSIFAKLMIKADNLTLCTFLCMKFVWNTHKHHVIFDMKQKDLKTDRDIDFDSYIATSAEPLKFPCLKSKFAFIIPLLKGLVRDSDIADLREIVSSGKTKNISSIHINQLRLQRLDTHLLRLLPVVSNVNMDFIVKTIHDIKIYCLGKLFAQSTGEFVAKGTEEISELFQYAHECLSHMPITEKKSEEIRAVALVHIAAWLIPLISVKHYDNLLQQRIDHQLHKLIPILTIAAKLNANERIEEPLAQVISYQVERALVKFISQEFLRSIKQFLLPKDGNSSFRKMLIETMLSYFCEQDDFYQYMLFIENYEYCSSRWVLLSLAKAINAPNTSLLRKIRDNVIQTKLYDALAAVRNAKLFCVRNNDTRICTWVDGFSKNFMDLGPDIVQYLDTNAHIGDITLFSEKCQSAIGDLRTKLEKTIELPEEGNVNDTKTWLFSLPENLLDEFSSIVIGCKAQCPLCGNVCDSPLPYHRPHSVRFHIPIGINGGADKESNKLLWYVCPVVVSHENFRASSEFDRNKVTSIQDLLQSSHSEWKIDGSNDSIPFWKYILKRFNRDLSEYYGCLEAEVPPEWNYSKEEAMKSVAMG